MRRTAWCVGLLLAAACGDDDSTATGDDAASSSSTGTIDPSSESSSAGGSSSEEGSTTTGEAVDSSSTGLPADGSSSSESESSTTEGTVEDCSTLGCPNPDEWCVTRENVTDTDGEGSSTTRECMPLPKECVGITGRDLALCLEPFCCDMGSACVNELDEREMQVECYSDPGTSCCL